MCWVALVTQAAATATQQAPLQADEPALACARTQSGYGHGHVVFATLVSNLPELRVDLQSWIDEGWTRLLADDKRFFAVGDASFADDPMDNVVPAPMCHDTSKKGLACKVADLFIEAQRRNADWVVFTHMDMWVAPAIWESILSRHSISEPAVLAGSSGCGSGALFESMCPALQANGGICGGRPWAANRGAFEKLLSNGADALRSNASAMGTFAMGAFEKLVGGGADDLRSETSAMDGRLAELEDMGASCLILERDVPILGTDPSHDEPTGWNVGPLLNTVDFKRACPHLDLECSGLGFHTSGGRSSDCAGGDR